MAKKMPKLADFMEIMRICQFVKFVFLAKRGRLIERKEIIYMGFVERY